MKLRQASEGFLPPRIFLSTDYKKNRIGRYRFQRQDKQDSNDHLIYPAGRADPADPVFYFCLVKCALRSFHGRQNALGLIGSPFIRG